MSSDPNCIFCKIARGQIPANKVYEDDEVMAFQARTGAEYALLHGHYWLSGLVAVELSQRLNGIPVVQMFHTLGVVKNALAEQPAEQVPQARVDAEAKVAARADRIVAATPLESAELAWYCGADVGKVRTIPCGVDVELFSPGSVAAARERLGLDAEWVLLFVGLLYLRPEDTFPELVGLRLILIVGSAVFLVWALRSVSARRAPVAAPALGWMVAFAGVAVLSLLPLSPSLLG